MVKGQMQFPIGRAVDDFLDQRQVDKLRNTEVSSTIVPVTIEPETWEAGRQQGASWAMHPHRTKMFIDRIESALSTSISNVPRTASPS
jgi:hypothetical protein